MRIAATLALHFFRLTGPDGQEIVINTQQVVSVREPRNIEGHFHKDVHCLVHLTDGKFVAVVESCRIVRELMEDELD